MLDFVLYSNPWKNRYVDYRDILLKVRCGIPAHLAFIVCKEPRLAWAQVGISAPDPAQLARQLQAMNAGNGPARVYASAPVRKQLQPLCPADWTWPVPQSGGENASGLLRRFESVVGFSLGYVRECSPHDEERGVPGRFEDSTRSGDFLWERQFSLQVWNERLSACADFFLPLALPSGQPGSVDSHQLILDLFFQLQAAQRQLPPLGTPPVYRAPPAAVYLDGVDQYPRSVQEAQKCWNLSPEHSAAVKRIPWPAVRELVHVRVAALERHLQPQVARRLAAGLFSGQEAGDLDEALRLLEEHSVWRETFPPFQFRGDRDREREQLLQETSCVSKMLQWTRKSGPLSTPLSWMVKEFLSRRFPLVDIKLASFEQMVFSAEVLGTLDGLSMDDELRRDCGQAMLGLDARALAQVRAWKSDDKNRKPGFWSLQPSAARAENEALWSLMGTAPGRWIRLEELVARLQGSGVEARSHSLDGSLSPALVAQACAGSDCRILLTERVSEEQGLAVRGLVCTEPAARKVVQAGWLRAPARLERSDRKALLDDTGPLPARSCVYFRDEY